MNKLLKKTANCLKQKHIVLVALVSLICMIIPFFFVGCSSKKILDEINKQFEDNLVETDIGDLLTSMPHIYINTQDEVLPTNKVDYVNCSFQITNTQDEADSFAIEMKKNYGDKNSVGIRLRGNSTMGQIKKPYRIKFDKKQSFFGSEKNKNWVLLADYLDPSDIRNYAALTLAEKFDNLDFTPIHKHVILYLNDQYCGLYLLTDHIDENTGRTDVKEDFDATVDKDFPFLIEMSHDANSGILDVDYFVIDDFEPIEIKYPEADERDDNGIVYDYIHSYMEAVLTLLKNVNQPINVSFRDDSVTLTDLVDEDSLIDFLLVNEIMGNWDSTWKSIKMFKGKTGKLKFGPVWDFDCCAANWDGTPNQTVYDLTKAEQVFTLGGAIASKWLAIGDNQQRFYDRFMEKRDCILEVVNYLIGYYPYITSAAINDATYWYGENGAAKFHEQYKFMLEFLTMRYATLAYLLKA